MLTVFEGDSITDAGRDYADEASLGGGYAYYAAEELRAAYPAMRWRNVAVSGNRSRDLLARAERVAALRPDVIGILVGINDVWRKYDGGDETPCAEFEANYRAILSVYRARTDAKLILAEPFLLDRADKPFRPDLDPKIDAVRNLAREFADVYVPLDGLMAAAAVARGAAYWSEDGVHPNAAGARLIGGFWAEAFRRVVRA